MITIKIPFEEFMEIAQSQLEIEVHPKISITTPDGETKKPYSLKYYSNHGEENDIVVYPDFIEFYIKT